MKKTIFNDPEMRQRTRQQLAKDFAVDERPVLIRIKEWLGVGQPEQIEQPQSMQPASYSPWERMREEKKNAR